HALGTYPLCPYTTLFRSEQLAVTLEVRAGDTGRLFGSVTPADVAGAIKAAGGALVEKRAIAIASPIKTIGKHQVAVQLHPEVAADRKSTRLNSSHSQISY